MAYEEITGTKATALDPLAGSIPDAQLVIVPDPVTGKLLISTFGQMKSDIINAFGGISYLDPIQEYPTFDAFPNPGAVKTLYVITTGDLINTQWRWGGSIYIQFPHGGDADVSGEALIRGNADIALQGNIDTVGASLTAAQSTLQSKITDEATARANADTNLQNNINAETNARQNNDNILQGVINAEGTTRLNADNALSARIDSKLNAADYNPHYKSKYTTLALLQAAHPTANIGDYAQVDAGLGSNVINYNWDTDDGWVQGSAVGPSIASTDDLTEGATNLYFTAARAQAAVDISGKVDKVTGKDLSQEDYTTSEKSKLAGIADGAQVNDANTTLQGNSFNGPNQLVKTDGAGKLPAIDGSQLTNLPASAGGSYYGTAAGTNTYTAAITGIAAYAAGLTIEMKFTNANTGASTININGIGAINLVKNGTAAMVAGDIPANAILTLCFGGTNFQIVGSINALPVVITGEKAVTVKTDGAHADYDVIDSASASGTTGSTLAAQDWSAGAVSYTGIAGEERYYGNWYYKCSGTNVWWRTPFNLIVNDFIIGTVSDSGGVKTSAQMATLYPAAVAPQIATGTAGIYMYIGLAGWFYFPKAN